MSCSRLTSKYWSENETSMLHFAFLCFGPNWKKIAQMLPGRSIHQIRQKYYYINSKLAIPDVVNTLIGTVAMLPKKSLIRFYPLRPINSIRNGSLEKTFDDLNRTNC